MTAPPKTPKAPPTDFDEARKACCTPTALEQLALIQRARWKPSELHEYARLYYFKNGRDYPTPMSHRRAIADLAQHYHEMTYTEAKPSRYPHDWLKRYRKGGSKPLPARRAGLLIRGRGLTHRVNADEYSWPDHTEEFRAMIEQRARDYFRTIPPDQPIHPNAWSASKRAYDREQEAQAEALRKETEATTLYLVPKSRKKSLKGPRRKPIPQHDNTFRGETLKPHFNYEFPGHTPAFREEVAALARKDRGKKSDAHITPLMWKITCHKRYVLIEK